MTLKDLKIIVDRSIESNVGKGGDSVVVIQMAEPGIPTHPMVGVSHAGLGFDWTNGRFILTPEQPVVRRKDQKV